MKTGTSSEGLGTQSSPWEGFDRELVLETYRAALGQLSWNERRALYAIEIKGWSYRRAAKRLGLPADQLRTLIFEARKKIQRRMEKALKRAPKPS